MGVQESCGKAYVFRGLPLVADSRTLRNGSFFDQPVYCTWEKSESSQIAGVSVVSFPLPKDGGGMWYKYPLYLIYIFLFSLFKIGRKDICVGMDLDVFICVWLGSFFKNTTLIFDVVDPASQARLKKLPCHRLIDRLELFFIRRAHFAMFPHASRLQYYCDELHANTDSINHLIIENVPEVQRNIHGRTSSGSDSKPLTIGYFGTLDGSRGLDLLLNWAMRNPQTVSLIIAGDGPLKSEVLEYQKKNEQIRYVGRYTASELAALYRSVDFSWMYYAPDIALHRYAAPNKFYEHLCFGVPVISNVIIPQAAFIREHVTGIIVDEAYHSHIVGGQIDERFLQELLEFSPGMALHEYWDEHYSGYYVTARERFWLRVEGARA